MNILVADDDSFNRKYLQALLSQQGHTVTECEDGLASLDWLRTHPCDAVISDVLMPRMDGYRLCYEIRKNKDLHRIPVILYTAAYLSAADEKAALAMGADKLIRKPAQPEQILAALHEAVEQNREKAAAASQDPEESSALREYSEALVRKLEETNIELSVANAALAENEQRLRAVIESEPECVKILARDGTLLEMNPAGLRMIEADSAAQVVGKDIGLLILPQYRRSFRELCEATFLGESGTVEFEIIGFKGTRRWLDTHSVPLRNSLGEIVASLGITRDVTEKKRNVQLLNDQMRLLEMIACGAPLRTTLDAILVAIEAQDDDLLCSILLLDAEGRRFTQCAAPRLPEPYRRYFEGAVVEENAGSCGLAVCRGEQVVVEDIARASLSETWRQIAISHGLRACCSMPIFDSHKQVVGSFAMYFSAPCRPMERQTPLIGIATHVAAIAIGKQREEDALRDSEARFRDMADSAPVMIWITRADGSCTYVNQQWQNFTGQVQEDPLGMGWLEAVHPEDCVRVKQEFADANRRRSPIRFECRLRRCDGEYRWVIHSAQPRISELGEFFGYIGSVLDISERKQAEDERQRSLDRVRALHEINLAITSTMNRQSQLDRLLEKIETFFPYPIVSSVRLLRPETGRLECLAQRGVDLRDWLRREPGRTLHRALQVVESKSPMVVGDIQRDALTHDRPMPSSFGLISYAGIPLIARDHVLGVLGVYTKVLHEFTTEEIEFLTALAGQASVAIQNTQLYEETERRRHEAEELAKIARSLTETLNIKAVADRVVNSVLELFNVRGSTLRLRQPDDSLVRLAAAGEVFSQTPIGVVMPGGVGLVGRAFAEGKPIWSADILNDSRIVLSEPLTEYFRHSPNRAMIAVPLRVHEELMGVVTMADHVGRSYSDHEIGLLQAFADQVALALQNARLYQQTESHLKRIEALRDIETAITSTLDLDSVLRLLLEKIDVLLPGSAATTIRLFNSSTGRFENTACRNIDEKEWKARIGQGTRSRSNEILRSRRPVIVANMQDEPGVSAAGFYREYGFVSYLGLPLIVKDEVQGILGFYTKQAHEFTQQEVDLLMTVAGQAAIAMNNARLYDGITLAKQELETTNRSLERSLRQLDGLYATLAPLDPEATHQEMMDAIIGRLTEATGADAGLIRIWDAETNNYRIISQRGYPDPFLKRVEKIPPGGSADWVVQHGEPILAPNIAAEERFQGKTQLAYDFRSAAMLPMLVHEDVRGVVQLSSKQVGYFDQEHREHLTAIARQLAIALENRRLFNDLRHSRDKLEKANAALIESNRMLTALHAVASASSRSLNLDLILQAAIQKMTEIFNFHAIRIHLFDKQQKNLTLRASFEHDREHFPAARVFQRGRGVVGAVVQSGEAMIFSDAPNDPRYRALTTKKLTDQHVHRFLAVFPIKGKAASLGTITCVNDSPRSLAAGEIQLLEAISGQLAVAIENSWLYEDVRSKVDELQLKTIELERANKVKDEFLGVISHELRTPINVMMGYTSLLKDGVLGAMEPAQENALAKIAREAKELLEMINTLLYATTLETEKTAVESQEFSPGSLFSEMRANYAVTAPRQVMLEWRYSDDLPSVCSDRRKLKQILDNLIGNAIKFTEQGTVTVAARLADSREHGPWDVGDGSESCSQVSVLEIAVTDTGVGMPSDKLDKIFEKFYQVDSSGARRFGGVGLGLFIAKKFAELLGGRLTVTSTEGVGSTFTLILPGVVLAKQGQGAWGTEQ